MASPPVVPLAAAPHPYRLAELERIVAAIRADADLSERERLAAELDVMRRQAYGAAARMRQAYRTLKAMRDACPPGSATWRTYEDALAVLRFELLDEPERAPQPGPQPEVVSARP